MNEMNWRAACDPPAT